MFKDIGHVFSKGDMLIATNARESLGLLLVDDHLATPLRYANPILLSPKIFD